MRTTQFILTCASFLLASVVSEASEEPWSGEFTPPPGKYSWVQLDTGEWLKGDITALYDDMLVFDSDHFDDLNIDLEDIAQIRAVGVFNVTYGDRRLGTRRIVAGQFAMSGEQINVIAAAGSQEIHRDELVSITRMAERELERWSGDLSVGWNVRRGNSDIVDYSLNTSLRRRTPISRFSFDYIGNQNKTDGVLIEDTHRITASADRFTSTRFFWRPVSGAYYKDELQNIKHQGTLDTGAGFQIIDTSRTSWEVLAGVGGNYLENVSVEAGAKNGNWSPVATLGSDFEYELTSWMDFELNIDMTFLEEDAGKYQHHIVSSLSTDLVGNLDLDLSFIWDRTEKPQPSEDSTVPEQDDYRIVVSLSYDF